MVESDFFAWPGEVGGLAMLKTLARRVARFDWSQAPNDIAAILYETVIPPDERRQLGEYYTPDWLARAMVREVVTDPQNQYVLDPACGSGTFIAEAVTHFIDTAKATALDPEEVLEWLRFSVTGIDVHPVAVHLARAAWVLAARPAIQAAQDAGYGGAISAPVYLGDALQLRFQTGDMFAEREVTIDVEDDRNSELVFPLSLVDQAEIFDPLMGDIADCVERGQDPMLALDDHGITDPGERETLEVTIATLQWLHDEGRDHIWAYYTRNLVRPVALSRRKVDVIIGNPPWLIFRNTASTLRTELERQSRNVYGIWAGGRYAAVQDIAGLFYARCADLYLKDGGVIGMVMPHSALQTGQYSKWRTGKWSSNFDSVIVDFGWKTAWDLERLQPNTFFPVPASVVFAARRSVGETAAPLAGEVERWLGKAGAPDVRRERAAITDTSAISISPYDRHCRKGADLFPRRLYFVEETENPAIVQAGRTVTVNPRCGSQDKRPWCDLDLTAITQQTVESAHLFDVHLGETLAPYVTLDPLKALLPIKRTGPSVALAAHAAGVGGVRLGSLERRMRERWRTISSMWDQNKSPNTKRDLIGNLDYYGKLSAQLEWRRNSGDRPIRVVYGGYGAPTAALLHDDDAIVDYKLFWIKCRSAEEGNYLLGIINSDTLFEFVTPLMSKGRFGARDLQKHLWKLPIPEFAPGDPLHVEISRAGRTAAQGAARELAALHQNRPRLTWRIARRELRKWLRVSEEGKAVEEAVQRLL